MSNFDLYDSSDSDDSLDDDLVLSQLEKMLGGGAGSNKPTTKAKPKQKISPKSTLIESKDKPEKANDTSNEDSDDQDVIASNPITKKSVTGASETGAPSVTDLTLATMTITSNIDTLINLEVVTRYMALDDFLTGKSCDGIGKWGEVNPKKKKSKKKLAEEQEALKSSTGPNKNRNKKDFYNQSTVIIHPYSIYGKGGKDGGDPKGKDRKINTKLFNNGQIVMTGCKDVDEAHRSVKALINGLNTDISGAVSYKPFTAIKQEFRPRDFEKFLKATISQLNYLLKYALTVCKVNYFPNLAGMFTLEALLTPHYNLEALNKSLEQELMVLIKFYQIFLLYLSPEDILGLFGKIFEGTENFDNEAIVEFMIKTNILEIPKATPHLGKYLTIVVDQVFQNYNSTENKVNLVVPAFIRADPITYDDKSTRIDMINSYFYTNFLIDRIKIQQILVSKYGVSADFKPDGYQGVNAKYISRVNCILNQHKLCKCNNKKNCKCPCKCKEVSIFIFRKGTIIITGARTWAQIMDTYGFITKVLILEYRDIFLKKAPKEAKSRKDAEPSKVIADGHIWLNKKTITKNPKNFFLIKEFNIQHLLNDSDQ